MKSVEFEMFGKRLKTEHGTCIDCALNGVCEALKDNTIIPMACTQADGDQVNHFVEV